MHPTTRLSFAALLLAPAALGAQARPYAADKAHSQINFVAETRITSTHGYWNAWDAEIAIDPVAPEHSTVAITIESAAITTRNDRRDNHLRSPDFFAADSFPRITFVSRSINKLSDTRYHVTGDLTIRGVTKSVMIPTTVAFFDREAGQARVRGAFSVNRQDYGVSYKSPRIDTLVEDEVQIQFDMHLRDREKLPPQRPPQQAPAQRPPS